MQGLASSFLLITASCTLANALKSQRIALSRSDIDFLAYHDVLGRGGLAQSIAPCHGLECAEKYVALKDSSFSWSLLKEHLSDATRGVRWEASILNMTSQRWMGRDETNHQLWWHLMVIITPSNLGMLGNDSEHWATLFTGNGDDRLMITKDNNFVQSAALMATLTGTTAAVVFQVPNQPISFEDDPSHVEKGEEAMKAWGWRRTIDQPGHPEHLIEIPIAKALVRALDTVVEFTSHRVNKFAITGFSKRGVGAWMAAALDPRVKAIMPGCHDMNLTALNHAMSKSYGHDPVAVYEYAQQEISAWVDNPLLTAIFEIVDPTTSPAYMKRLERLDKFFMAASNDDFFMIDHAKTWLHSVPGPTTYMMKPNKAHLSLMSEDDFLLPAAAFLQSAITKTPMPKISWEVSNSGAITVHQVSNHTPSSVKVWHADTCAAAGMRDFRQMTAYKATTCLKCGIPLGSRCRVTRTVWRSMDLPASAGSDGKTWVVSMEAPQDGGWRGFFVEFTYQRPMGSPPWVVTTEASVVPQQYPFPDCTGHECNHGHLLVLAQMN